jgi:hypothetical protein
MPFELISKNKIFFYKEPWSISDNDMNQWPYWWFEEVIKAANKKPNEKSMTIEP